MLQVAQSRRADGGTLRVIHPISTAYSTRQAATRAMRTESIGITLLSGLSDVTFPGIHVPRRAAGGATTTPCARGCSLRLALDTACPGHLFVLALCCIDV